MLQPRLPATALYIAAMVAGTSYFVAVRTGFSSADMTAWKGAGVGLLALWALRQATNRNGVGLAAVLALHATGDVLLETHGLTVGAVAFLAGHLLAAGLYLGERVRSWWIVVAVLAVTTAVAWLLPTDRAAAPGVALYAAGLGMMAGAAAMSRLPVLVPAGAMLFVLSDWLIFARMGPLADSVGPDWTVWPTYFAGQAMIAAGAVRWFAGAKR